MTSVNPKWYLPVMLRRLLGCLLILTWVFLSGIDLLEDFDFGDSGPVIVLPDDSTPNAHRPLKAVNNIVESAEDRKPSYAFLFNLAAVSSSFNEIRVLRKAARLHKLHRVFLI